MIDMVARALLVEDDPGFAAQLATVLSLPGAGPAFEPVHAPTLAAARRRLSEGRIEVVLLDLGLPDSQGLDTLEAITTAAPGVPVVVLTGQDHDETARGALQQGAEDYLVKGTLTDDLLRRSVRYAIERKRAADAQRRTELRARAVIENTLDLIVGLDACGEVVFASPSVCTLLGHGPAAVTSTNMQQWVHEDDRQALDRAVRDAVECPGKSLSFECRLRHADGSWRVLELSGKRLPEPAAGICGIVNARDITARRLAEDELERQKEVRARLSSAVEQAAEAIMMTTPGGEILYVNPAFERITGYSATEARGQTPRILKSEKQDPAIYHELWDTITHGHAWSGEIVNRRRDGTSFVWEETITPVRAEDGSLRFYISISQDISARRSLEAQLRQAQKMEAIGRLAGGVAHDFNNLLTVITGYSERLLSGLQPDDPLRKGADAIKRSAERAAALTQQLLAFSRRQLLALRVMDLNAVVANMNRLLPRLIGEDIHLVIVPGSNLGAIKADPSQIEQVIMNLAVNSRDAMPAGGTLTIETASIEVDASSAIRHVGLTPGRYVMLAVSDTGCGMDEQVRAHLFEPFFTTKEQGKGTGLGLSTVYGIVKQCGGYIWVDSEPGAGTCATIYLPRVEQRATEKPAREAVVSGVPRGSETILLVEDEDPVRQLISDVLGRFGYLVLHARNGQEALRISGEYQGVIHLVITDMVMPKMNGWEVAAAVTRIRPDAKVLYMSGYTEHAIVQQGVRDSGVAFLGKPFTPDTLGRKVREVLGPPVER